MPALYLTNDDVARLLPMDECVEVLEDLFRQESRGLVENISRQRRRFARSSATLMGGVVLGSGYHGVRHATATLLYSTDTGRLEAVIEPSTLAWIRTGAASGVAVKHMARSGRIEVGVLGAGRQAVTQLEAICAVREVTRAKVYARTEATRRDFAAQMRERLGVDVVALDNSADCVRGSDVVVAITNAREPVFDGALLEPGTCVVAAGVNSWSKREIDETTIERAELVAVDNLEQAKIECGDLLWAAEHGRFLWGRAVELHDVVSGRVPGRPSDEAITLFESQGIGIEDIAASAHVLHKARAQGIGVTLPF